MTLGRGWPRSAKSPNIPQKNPPSQISFPDVPGIYRPRHPGGRDSGSKGRTKRLQVFFKFNRRLLGDLCRCALRSLICYGEVHAPAGARPGADDVSGTRGQVRLSLGPYLEFIARVTSHIPDKGQVMVRYKGLYANAHIHRLPEASA